MTKAEQLISKGFSDAERAQIARLYWQAFGSKLARTMGPTDKALRFISRELDPDFALVARNGMGRVLGVAGFKTSQGALVGGGFDALAEVYGWLSAAWRGPLLGLVERELAEDVLLMDGICVASCARGQGIGTALLNAIKDEARLQGLRWVRLDVIDSNARARALYERQGFEAIGEERLGPLALVFGFASSTKMRCDLASSPAPISVPSAGPASQSDPPL